MAMPGVRRHFGAGSRVALSPGRGDFLGGVFIFLRSLSLAVLPDFACFRLMELAETGSRRVLVSPPPLQGVFCCF